MSEQNQPDEDLNLQAPPKLVEALRGLEQQVILVPPQIDEAALSRPRLHLRRLRQHREQAQDSMPVGSEELALAARAAETSRPVGPLASEGGRDRRPGRSWGWKVGLWLAIVALITTLLLVHAFWNPHPQPRRSPEIQYQQPPGNKPERR